MRRRAFTVSRSGSPGPCADQKHMCRYRRRDESPCRCLVQRAKGIAVGIQKLPLRESMKQSFALFAARMRGQNFAPQLAELLSQGPRSSGNCSSISRRSRWATAGLSPAVEMAICKIAAADHRSEVEVAVR